MEASEYTEKYAYSVQWSEEDNLFIATVLEFPSLSAHGLSGEEALSELKSVVLESVKWMIEDEEEVPLPFSIRNYKGNIALRLLPETHRKIAQNAAKEGVSCNRYLSSIIESSIVKDDINNQINALHNKLEALIEQFSRLESQFELHIETTDRYRYPQQADYYSWGANKLPEINFPNELLYHRLLSYISKDSSRLRSDRDEVSDIASGVLVFSGE